MLYILYIGLMVISIVLSYRIGHKQGYKNHKFSYSTRINRNIIFEVAPGEKIFLKTPSLLDNGCEIYGVERDEDHSMVKINDYGSIMSGVHIHGNPNLSNNKTIAFDLRYPT